MSGLLGEIGTIEWCRRTNGILGRGERARFMAATVLRAGAALPRVLALRLGLGGGGPDPSRLAPPDSAFARELVDACGDLDPMVVEHGYRSYLFGRALGEAEGLECDEEGLFAATMLHDYAFARIERLTDRCFTLAGAEVAADLLAASPLAPRARHEVLDAITLHLNPRVGRERARCSTWPMTASSSTCSAYGPGSWTAPGSRGSSSAIPAQASPRAPSRSSAGMAGASPVAGRAPSSRPASGRP